LTPEEARSRFEAEQVAVLGTIGPTGGPHLVPVVYAVDGDEVHLAVDSKPKRDGELARITNLRSDPRCSLLVHGYDEDWRRLWWARADGRASIAEDGPARERSVALLRDRYPQYRRGTEIIGPAIVVKVERWSGWSADDGGRAR
jgi:PPOX class probable F420-dependent enzyme